MHCVDDRIDVFLLLFLRIGVVEAQVASATVILRKAEVEADRLGVAEVQIAIRFRWKARADRNMLAGGKVGIDNIADEVRDLVF